jgi:intracellular multiplication protein IcmL
MSQSQKGAKKQVQTAAPKGAVEHVQLRLEFYRDSYRKLVVVSAGALIVALLQTGIIYFLASRPVRTDYFATEGGRIIPLQPLNAPVLTQRQVLSFAQEASVEAYTFDFVNYRKQLQGVAGYFTQEGYSEYIEALSRSNLDIVTQKKYVVSAVASGAPVVTREGLKQGVYVWEVQMPMSVAYQSASERADQKFIVRMLLKRIPTTLNPRGIGVHQIMLEDSTVPQA